MAKLVMKMIKFYRAFLIGFFKHGTLPLVPSSSCKFYPSCSEYAAESIKRHGLGVGLIKAAKRIFRCHPWASPGADLP